MRAENARLERLQALPPLLRQGFRPFFLGGALWAPVALALWLLALTGRIALPSAFDPQAWHRHEMLFGYLAAVIAGYALTIMPNRTGRLPNAGAGLAGIAALWLAARLAVLGSAWLGPWFALLADAGFLLLLTALLAHEAWRAGQRRAPVVFALVTLTGACLLDHGALLGWPVPAGLGWRLAMAMVVLLISLVGGRIIPSFTHNWLARLGDRRALPGQPGRFDQLVLAVLGIALGGWILLPDSALTGALLVAAGLLKLARLARWQGHRALGEPLVIALHLAFLWLALGTLLLGASLLRPLVPASVALHLIGAGGAGTMTLAVMIRTIMRQQGRGQRADRLARTVLALVTLGTLLRAAAHWFPVGYDLALAIAVAAWGGAFVLFVAGYGPWMLGWRRARR
jgi:uncharacterized protein involved in response to NO